MVSGYISDKQLAECEVIVVAHWPKSRIEPHDKHYVQDGRNCALPEAHGTLFVERVIKGDVDLGLQPLMLAGSIGWNEDGKRVSSCNSTLVPAAVEDVTEPAIWFLKRRQSWKTDDPTDYLHPQSYRSVQPINLEPFYRAIISDDPCDCVATLLQSSDDAVILQAMQYLNGVEMLFEGVQQKDWLPTVSPLFLPASLQMGKNRLGYEKLEKRQESLSPYSEKIAALLTHSSVQVRAFAALMYAKAAGWDSVDRLRPLLIDDSEDVRAITMTLLATFKDEEALDSITGNSLPMNCKTTMQAVVALSRWQNVRVVPLLIRFLENVVGPSCSEVNEPATVARDGLRKFCRTGDRAFPFDTTESERIWSLVKDLPEADRTNALLKMLPLAQPLSAVVTGLEKRSSTKMQAAITLTNNSDRVVDIANDLTTVLVYTLAGSRSHTGNKQSIADASLPFVTLPPAEHFTFYADIITRPLDDELIELGELDDHNVTDCSTLLQCDLLFGKLPEAREGAVRWCGAIKPAGLPCAFSGCVAGGSEDGPCENHRPRRSLSPFERWLKRIWPH